MPRLPRGGTFEARTVEGVYLEYLDFGVYKVLIGDENNTPKILEYRHVTFEEKNFPGAPYLDQIMEAEASFRNDV